MIQRVSVYKKFDLVSVICKLTDYNAPLEQQCCTFKKPLIYSISIDLLFLSAHILKHISHYANGGWDILSTVSASGSEPYTVSRTGITSLSPYAVSGENNGGALPIELVEFTAKPIGFDAVLNWVTASETNRIR